MIRWLQSEGYTVEYATRADLHSNANLLSNYRLVLLIGHDEYFSKVMRDHLDTYLAIGGNLAVFAGNTLYRQIRFEDNNRTMVGYKGFYQNDPMFGVNNILVTTEFDRSPVNWPQNSTIGLGWTGWVNSNPTSNDKGCFTAYRTDHWVFNETGLQDGGTFWYEPSIKAEVGGVAFTWNNELPVASSANNTLANLTILGIGPSTKGHATMAVFNHAGGGTVFNAATQSWAYGLQPENNPGDYTIVRQITRNVLNRLSASSPPSGTCASLSQEAEQATLLGSFSVTNDANASGGQYISPGGFSGGVANNGNQAIFCFNVSTPGTYKLIGTVYAPSGSANPFFVQVDGLTGNGYLWEQSVNPQYVDDALSDKGGADPVLLSLNVGQHAIVFFQREKNIRLDKVRLELVAN